MEKYLELIRHADEIVNSRAKFNEYMIITESIVQDEDLSLKDTKELITLIANKL